MFSYQHAFHAGNHADVLKHAVLWACLQHLMQKEGAVSVVDTHAGIAVYDLQGSQAQASQESAGGVLTLQQQQADTMPELWAQYLQAVQQFQQAYGNSNLYPGSPALAAMSLRPHDRLNVFEVHPTDYRRLREWADSEPSAAKVNMWREDGFASLRRFLPPPERRGLVVCDPSYELKTDYDSVAATVEDALRRFATGMMLVWMPLVARPQAHSLPRKLKTLAQKAGKPWVQALLQVHAGHAGAPGGGLAGSSVWVVNPPYTLHEQLRTGLPYLVKVLGQDKSARFELTQG